MPVRKISISLSPRALEIIDRAAGKQRLTRSAWVEQAAQQAALECQRQAAIAQALAEHERETGRAITAKELEAARAAIYGKAHGLSRPHRGQGLKNRR